MPNRIYFNYDTDRAALFRWLADRPGGRWRVLLGTKTGDGLAGELVAGVSRQGGRGLGLWLVDKLQRGEMQVRQGPPRDDLPAGVPLEARP
jgi:hypothetical protein